MIVQEFLNVVSEERKVIEEEWKEMKNVEWEKMHAVRMFARDVLLAEKSVCAISSALDDSAVEYVLQKRVKAHGGVKAEWRVLEADWRDRKNMSQDAEKEVLLEFLGKKNLQRAEVDLLMIIWLLKEKSVSEIVVWILLDACRMVLSRKCMR
ncbi:uncharacterized protein MONOS_10205 [Monocercomonoides exilis]|uniref:uncharacterized protein n=1 Tax=Monocercomonoides exilis TaxID=2049356 RepID=UPI0035596926|nr:hypothetical protein MONOS_10205 [Monocercomonoides exilis]|eukprot:MONOS_10205.1-p1 / transcript=MONOS_10205.1 / gene=MONOS_10205 / organism=Monocercomonoides_exilis_PA203 / gene_product=unspecified product / transcript_product=unspecified product / location=Mono_scaffold00454:5453-6057(-) / protein_length=152 / sequence_SO=supercontig / SO=protein_coding / is_pseudo=false